MLESRERVAATPPHLMARFSEIQGDDELQVRPFEMVLRGQFRVSRVSRPDENAALGSEGGVLKQKLNRV